MDKPPSQDPLDDVAEAILQGQKLQAIKRYRDATGASLGNAKREVERIEASLRQQYPDRFPAASSGKGCSVSAGLFLLCGLGGAYGLPHLRLLLEHCL